MAVGRKGRKGRKWPLRGRQHFNRSRRTEVVNLHQADAGALREQIDSSCTFLEQILLCSRTLMRNDARRLPQLTAKQILPKTPALRRASVAQHSSSPDPTYLLV